MGLEVQSAQFCVWRWDKHTFYFLIYNYIISPFHFLFLFPSPITLFSPFQIHGPFFFHCYMYICIHANIIHSACIMLLGYMFSGLTSWYRITSWCYNLWGSLFLSLSASLSCLCFVYRVKAPFALACVCCYLVQLMFRWSC